MNTDFAQVEADDQQINLSRFSLFFPEKRRFFQERAVNFDFGLGGDERLFHSRQIGLVAGEPVTIYGGARLVGRVGEWDVGLLDMQTDKSRLLPSENFGVLRLRRRIFNSTPTQEDCSPAGWGQTGTTTTFTQPMPSFGSRATTT